MVVVVVVGRELKLKKARMSQASAVAPLGIHLRLLTFQYWRSPINRHQRGRGGRLEWMTATVAGARPMP